MSKPTLPKGTRDFLPQQVAKREFLFNTIREVFKRYGYHGIETPAMESLSTLTGKYGEEGDQLLFKVLNNGDYLSKADPQALEARDSSKLVSSIAKRGLRYDLTVPFARYVVMHQNDLQLPFKRFAIQPVWRADRPQKGRYQEFYQCDVDVVGSTSLMYEAELIQIFDEAYYTLGIPVQIRVNNRKILEGIAEVFGIADQFSAFAVIIDKLDKIGKERIAEQLCSLGLELSKSQELVATLSIDNLAALKDLLKDSERGKLGIEELEGIHVYLDSAPTHNEVILDVTLARGLSYYTGCILEVKAIGVQMGSIGGGGRYDDLTGNFGLKGVSGVGISLGAERIYDVMEELNLFHELELGSTQAIILCFDDESHKYGFQLGSDLRKHGISTEIYPEPAKFKKQMKYAGEGAYNYAIIIGEEERTTNNLTIKNLQNGDQVKVNKDSIIAFFS
ncbi:MAG: histidyl-tRNA synthetase [Saprospiraceae bacterium]|jgi:histidyl-tRNA synthetase